jgi:hypothetical protein
MAVVLENPFQMEPVGMAVLVVAVVVVVLVELEILLQLRHLKALAGGAEVQIMLPIQ